MRLLNLIVGLLCRLSGTYCQADLESMRVFEDAAGVWRFQTPDGGKTWGSYPTRADAIRAASKYNFFEVID